MKRPSRRLRREARDLAGLSALAPERKLTVDLYGILALEQRRPWVSRSRAINIISSVLSVGLAWFFGSLAYEAHTDARVFARARHIDATIISIQTSKGGAFGRIRFSTELGNDCEVHARLGSTSNGFRLGQYVPIALRDHSCSPPIVGTALQTPYFYLAVSLLGMIGVLVYGARAARP